MIPNTKTNIRFKSTFLVSLLLTYLEIAFGQSDLSSVALFTRCYGQITQELPAANHPIFIAVSNASTDPIEGCLSILRESQFTEANGNELAAAPARDSIKVLETMHKLHSSWFYTRYFPQISNDRIRDLVDSTQPALYLTRALFSPGARADSILTLDYGLKPIRALGPPALGPFSNQTKEALGFPATLPFASIGELRGVTRATNGVIATVGTTLGPDIGTHYGGGYLGDQAYLRATLGDIRTFRSDGGENMAREWSKAVFHDTLCRDLPVIRVADAQKFVAGTSTIPFRTSAGCNVCHASIDRLAMTVRGIRYHSNANGVDAIEFTPPTGSPLFYTESGTGLTLPSWPTASVSTFHTTKPSGVLYLRDLNGALKSIPIGSPNSTTLTVQESLATLGKELTNLDDFYVCLASRYYHYFTGVKVSLNDPSSPDDPRTLSSQDQYHLSKVKNLGQDLRASQSVMKLIEQIVRSMDYRKSNFGH